MLVTVMMLLAAPVAAPADPLAPARSGKVQCVAPNKEKKTCMAIGSYVVRADGSYDTTVRVLINPAPEIVMETRSSGTIEDGKVCGTIRKEDYEAAKLTMNGAPMDEGIAAAIRPQIMGAVAPMAGKKGCSTEKPEGDLILSEVTLDGVARPELTQRFIWVNAGEYALGAP